MWRRFWDDPNKPTNLTPPGMLSSAIPSGVSRWAWALPVLRRVREKSHAEPRRTRRRRGWVLCLLARLRARYLFRPVPRNLIDFVSARSYLDPLLAPSIQCLATFVDLISFWQTSHSHPGTPMAFCNKARCAVRDVPMGIVPPHCYTSLPLPLFPSGNANDVPPQSPLRRQRCATA